MQSPKLSLTRNRSHIAMAIFIFLAHISGEALL